MRKVNSVPLSFSGFEPFKRHTIKSTIYRNQNIIVIINKADLGE